MKTPAQGSLDRAHLVATAFVLLEDEGLDRLSMRRLAARLGVQAPALYWHVRDKGELLGLMASAIYAAAYAGVGDVQGDWRAWLRAFWAALRGSLAAHRDGVHLCARAHPVAQGSAEEQARRIAAPVVALGLTQEQALAYQAAVISFTLGWATFEANGPMRDHLHAMMDFPAAFTTGLDALVRGLG